MNKIKKHMIQNELTSPDTASQRWTGWSREDVANVHVEASVAACEFYQAIGKKDKQLTRKPFLHL